jgi:poly(A) polymerase
MLRTLRQAGHEAYFAGGCVRDELLGLHPTDYDIATSARPEQVRRLFRGTHHVGEAFGVVLVPIDQDAPRGTDMVEVATFRSDGPYSDQRRPDRVIFSDPLGDARRRDFTINALFLDPLQPESTLPGLPPVRGRVIDHVGGIDDLRARIVRAVGDPDMRLREDHLRALRAVRFTTRLQFTLDPATAQAIRRHAASLAGVSRERIGDELRRMFAHPSRAQAATMLQDLGLDAAVLNEDHRHAPLLALRSLPAELAADGVAPPLAAWALDRHGPIQGHPLRALVGRWRDALCLSNDERRHLENLLLLHAQLVQWTGDPGTPVRVAAEKRLFARPEFRGAVALLSARNHDAAQQFIGRYEHLSNDGIGLNPPPLLSGDTLVSLGYKPGPGFRRVLDAVYDLQLEGAVRTTRQAEQAAVELMGAQGVIRSEG